MAYPAKEINLMMKMLGCSLLFVGITFSAPPGDAVQKGVRWLVSSQGADGGWGQDGGGSSTVRVNQRREAQGAESMGNDVANTSVAALALIRGSAPREPVRRAVEFVLRHVEESPEEGLAITRITGTQIQGKLGPYIDTFLGAMLLSEVEQTPRVKTALQKCVRKIERNQQKDGSWNISGGWAPVLGTSIASQGLFKAREKGIRVEQAVLDKAKDYAARSAKAGPAASTAESAGVSLYAGAQQLEQLSRSSADRRDNRDEIRTITAQLSDQRFVRGFGSMGGEEFFSYLNISDSLQRAGGEDWFKWNRQIKETLVKLQNEDGTWAGHHCITGR
ncbi:MAG: hypothetical protein ACRD44_12385, partial [Bryobacteraceae bacterium]